MGETRVDLQHLLEDLRDAYVGPAEETILTEIVANSLDSGAARIDVAVDPVQRTFTLVDDGAGMRRRELARYHDIAASTKTRGEGIGFAGVGIKMALLVCREVLTETRQRATHVATTWALTSRHRAPWKWVSPPGARRRARDGGAPHRGQCALAAARSGLRRDRAPAPLPAALRSDLCRDPPRSLSDGGEVRDQRAVARARGHRGAGDGADRRAARPPPQGVGGGLSRPRAVAAARGSARARHQHPRQGHQARLGLARDHARRSRAGGWADRGAGPCGAV